MKWNVLGVSAGSPQFLDHAHGAVGIEAVHHYGRGTLQLGMRGQERSYGEAGAFVIRLGRSIVFGHQVMIQKDRIVTLRFQKFFRLGYLAGDIQLITLEASCEPFTTPLVIFEEKYSHRMAAGIRARQTELVL